MSTVLLYSCMEHCEVCYMTLQNRSRNRQHIHTHQHKHTHKMYSGLRARDVTIYSLNTHIQVTGTHRQLFDNYKSEETNFYLSFWRYKHDPLVAKHHTVMALWGKWMSGFTLHFVPLLLNLLNRVLGGPPSSGDMVKWEILTLPEIEL